MGDDDLVPDVISPEIDPAEFARGCLAAARTHNVSPHYLIVVANQVSKIQNIPSPVAGSDAFGPFQLTSDTWTTVALPMQFGPDERFDAPTQCFVAAQMTSDHNSGLKVVLPGQSLPSAVELFFAWTFGMTAATVTLGSGRDRSTSIQPALLDAFHNDTAKVTSVMNANADLLMQGGNPRTIDQVLDAMVTLLDPGLDRAITLIDQVEPGLFTTVPPSTGNPTGPSGGPTGPSGGPGGNPLTVFAAKAPVVMHDLIKDFGVADFQAAGVLGNAGQESGGFTQLQEINPIGGGRGGLGWFQWTGERRTDFEGFCARNGLKASDDKANYGFLKDEIARKFPKTIPALKATTTLEAATASFEATYEFAGVKAMARRIQWAQRAMTAFRSGGTS